MVAARTIIRDTGEMARLMAQLELAKNAVVKVGIQGAEAGARYKESGASLVDISVVHEFGSTDGHTPQRSFMRSAFDSRLSDLNAVKRKALEKVVEGRITTEEGLEIIGQWFQSAVQQQIRDLKEPKLAESTKARKKSSKLLIDTGRLRASITYVVDLKGGE